MPINSKSMFYIGTDVLRTDIEGPNTIIAQVGDATAGTSAEPAEMWQQVGFASRPSPVSGTGKNIDACQAIVIPRTDYNVVIATRDTRYQDIYGSLKEGETALYATGKDGKSQGRVLLKQDGSINLYSKKGNTSSGKGMGVFIDPMNDQISIINSKGFGIIINGDGIVLTSKGGSLKLTESGDVSLIGKGKCQIDGSGIMLGAVGVPGVNSVLLGVTGLAGVASKKCMVEL